jgi:hypothetical protein
VVRFDEDGTKKVVMASAGLDILNKFKKNPKEAITILETEGNATQKFNFDNFDLITWFIIS